MEEKKKLPPQNPRKVSWWKVGLGLLVLLGGLKNLGQRGVPTELVPSNEAQWFGYLLVTALFILVGLFFMIAGLRHLWINRPD